MIVCESGGHANGLTCFIFRFLRRPSIKPAEYPKAIRLKGKFMEHLGQSKTLLSERIAQQKLAEQAEAERWTKELKDIVRSDLRELVKGELDTTVSDMKAATAPLRSAMRQSRREALLLRRFSGIWWKACLIGACLSLGLGFGSWGC